MEAGDCPTLNMNAMENYLLSHSLIIYILSSNDEDTWSIASHNKVLYIATLKGLKETGGYDQFLEETYFLVGNVLNSLNS